MIVVKREQLFQLTNDLTIIGCYNLVTISLQTKTQAHISERYIKKNPDPYQSDELSFC